MKQISSSALLLIGFMVMWQVIVVMTELPSYILPTPVDVLRALLQQNSLLVPHLSRTLFELLMGFALGIILGSIAAILMSIYRGLSVCLLPLLIVSQAIPIFAIAPLIVIWCGYGLESKVVTTILMVFFPIVSNFYDGLKQTELVWLEVAKTMQGNRFRTFWHIRMPAAFPQLASGIRVAAVTAPIGAIVSEWVGSSKGLGYLMLNANVRMQIDVMFAMVLIIITMSLGLYIGVDFILRKLIWWK